VVNLDSIVFKIISLFSVVRGYNVFVLIIAQYLASIFIFAPHLTVLEVILNPKLFLLVLASAITIASGYIINNFYDSQKDLINRPHKSSLDMILSQELKLKAYFVFNFVAVLLAVFISFQVFLFFSFYIFLIWLYSHKIKRNTLFGNLLATLLTVTPFFAIVLHFYSGLSLIELNQKKALFGVIFGHALFLFLLILIREMIKDLENIKGDIVANYKTIPIVYGTVFSKKIITLLTILTIIPVYILIEKYDVGYMEIYFYSCFLVFIYFLNQLWKSDQRQNYLQLHNLFKFLIVLGVFCILLINPSKLNLI
jgi:4-hydroxybenzoate polyprenyltransferase